MYFIALGAIYVVVAAIVMVVAWRRLPWLQSRRAAAIAGVAWVAAASVEYWLLGPFSFLGTNAEMDLAPGIHLFLTRWHDGGQFAHAFGGGNDVAAATVFTGQVFSLERTLVAHLPFWLASAILRVAQGTLAYIGTYLLARRWAGASRDMAFAMGALYALSSEYMYRITWAHGLGYALIPLAVYVCVARAGRRHYGPGVAAIAILNAVSSTPTHSNLALFAALGLFAGLAGGRRVWLGFGTMIICAGFLGANWAESLYAKYLLAPYAIRADAEAFSAPSLTTIIGNLIDIRKETTAIGWLGVVLLFWRDVPEKWRGLAVFLLAALGGAVFQALPWEDTDLRFIGRINLSRIAYALNLLGPMLLVLAVAPSAGRLLPETIARGAIAVALALAIGQLAWVKTYNATNWLAQGGLRGMETAIARLSEPGWRTDVPSRVVSVPYRLPANFAVAAGLSTLDGGWNLNLRSLAHFWKDGIVRVPTDVVSSYIVLDGEGFDPLCCPIIDFDKLADADLLRLANVGYVLSIVPLQGRGLVEIAAPPTGPALPLRREPLFRKVKWYARAAFDPPPVHIYRLENPLPRVYAARRVVVAAAGTTDKRLPDLVREHGLERGIVIRAEDGAAPVLDREIEVLSFVLERDAVRIAVSAPARGAAVFNAPYTPFWRAYADGKPIPVVPVNQVQMAAPVPAGTREIVFRYARPRVWDKFILGY